MLPKGTADREIAIRLRLIHPDRLWKAEAGIILNIDIIEFIFSW